MSLFLINEVICVHYLFLFNKNYHIYLQGSKESDSGPGDDLNNLGPHRPATDSMVS